MDDENESGKGGGEKGEPWHAAGRLGNKTTSFTDFIAVADHLVRLNMTRAGRIVAVAVLCAAGLLIPQSAISGGGRAAESLGSCQSGDAVISIYDYGFNPDSVTINVGQTV